MICRSRSISQHHVISLNDRSVGLACSCLVVFPTWTIILRLCPTDDNITEHCDKINNRISCNCVLARKTVMESVNSVEINARLILYPFSIFYSKCRLVIKEQWGNSQVEGQAFQYKLHVYCLLQSIYIRLWCAYKNKDCAQS